MAVFKCKMCGGQLEISEGTTVCTCDYCGTEQTLPRLDSDKKANMYDRANHFRRNNDYDKAMSIYEQILNEDNTDAEAYWSLVLCKYGIEYVEDPVTHKRIPTINRAQYTSIYADENYKSALQFSDIHQRTVYEQEAKTIDNIQKGILAISEKEEPFDVFICYKETDANGRRTPDSVLANDLYHQLTQEGFKVFFAKITLEDKLGQEYEPYIFAALNSAKAMVVLGTKPEYFNAVWVKNEWSRYLALISAGEKKILIPAYRDMDPYDLPEEFSHLQAQDMSKLGFMQDLIRGIKKIIGSGHEQSINQVNVINQQSIVNANVSALLQRGNIAVEDGEYDKADEFFEEVLNINPECAEAYLGKYMLQEKAANVDSLINKYIHKYSEEDEEETVEACPEEKVRIENTISQYIVKNYLTAQKLREIYIFDRTYESNLESIKEQKNNILQELNTDRLFLRAKQYATGDCKKTVDRIISEITQTLDNKIAEAEKEDENNKKEITDKYAQFLDEADNKARKLYEEALNNREIEYNSIRNRMESAVTIEQYDECKNAFSNMDGYKDSYALIGQCNDMQNQIRERERRILIEKEKRRKKKKIIISTVSIGILLTACLIVLVSLWYKKNVYEPKQLKIREEQAIQLYNNSYKDLEVGQEITFGNNNGDMEWIVMDNKEGELLLLSKYVIEMNIAYDNQGETCEWKDCSLRKWLNDEFYESAFSKEEKLLILNSDLEGESFYADVTQSTTDKIFIFSETEYHEYYSLDYIAKFTNGSAANWWLRTPGAYSNHFYNYKNSQIVDAAGKIYSRGVEIGTTGPLQIGIRPAMWIGISDLVPTEVQTEEEQVFQEN